MDRLENRYMGPQSTPVDKYVSPESLSVIEPAKKKKRRSKPKREKATVGKKRVKKKKKEKVCMQLSEIASLLAFNLTYHHFGPY